MRHKWLILAAVALALVLSSLIFLMLPPTESSIRLGVNISRREGAETLFRVSLTNGVSRTVKLADRVQVTYLNETGHESAIDYVRLAGSGTDIGGLPPHGFDSILLRTSDPVGGVRLRFSYLYDADPLRQLLGRISTKLGFRPPAGQGNWPPSACWRWLIQNGLLDGKYHVTYDRTWFASTNLVQQ
jgi:hypothetical protein